MLGVWTHPLRNGSLGCDVLRYERSEELGPGLHALAPLLDAVAYLEVFTNADELEGDMRHWHHRTPASYRRAFRVAGLTAVAMHCYVGDLLLGATLALELAE